MFTMYDSVNLNEIPAEPHAVAAYINGEYANYEEAKKRFPHARILRISVTGLNTVADAYDIETGDYTADHVPSLYKLAHYAGVWRPCFYAQLSGVMPAVKKALNTVVAAREDVRLWVAYYNDTAELPAGYDAHQFTCTALGRNLDESLCASTFFQAAKPAPVVEVKPAEPWRAEVTVDTQSGHWDIKGLPANGS